MSKCREGDKVRVLQTYIDSVALQFKESEQKVVGLEGTVEGFFVGMVQVAFEAPPEGIDKDYLFYDEELELIS